MASLTVHYLYWHYTRGVRDLINIVRNFIWFFWEFFSIRLLLQTFFVPFNRLEERAPSGLHLDAMAQAMLINLLMRFVGMFVRLFVMTIGIVFLAATLAAGVVFLAVWLASPLMCVALIILGVVFLQA